MTFAIFTAMAVGIFGGEPVGDALGDETQVEKASKPSKIKIPRIESWDYKIHVAKNGKWTFQSEIICRYTGDDKEFVTELLEEMNREVFPRPSEVFIKKEQITLLDDDRWQSVVEADGTSMAMLAVMLNGFVAMEDDEFAWDKSTFELTGRRPEYMPMVAPERDEKKPIGDRVIEGVVGFFVVATIFNAAVSQLDLSVDDFVDESGNLRNLPRLTLTTDGTITADAPAEVSPDGKTLVIDYVKNQNRSFVLLQELKKWSIRIEDL